MTEIIRGSLKNIASYLVVIAAGAKGSMSSLCCE